MGRQLRIAMERLVTGVGSVRDPGQRVLGVLGGDGASSHRIAFDRNVGLDGLSDRASASSTCGEFAIVYDDQCRTRVTIRS